MPNCIAEVAGNSAPLLAIPDRGHRLHAVRYNGMGFPTRSSVGPSAFTSDKSIGVAGTVITWSDRLEFIGRLYPALERGREGIPPHLC